MVLLRIWVKDPSTGDFVVSQRDGDVPIPYKGYMEATLTIPGLPWYNEDMLLLVIPDHKYGERIPVQIGTKVINHLVTTMTGEELQHAGDT